MLSSVIIRTVDFCARRMWAVIIVAFVLAGLCGTYTISHFSLDTDVNNLISRDLPWRKRELAYQAAFPQTSQLILVVVDGPTAEQTGAAAHDLAQRLSNSPLIRSVDEMQGGTFFQQSRFLFMPAEEVALRMTQLSNAQPVISILARDPSLRGLLRAMSLSLQQFKYGIVSLDDATPAFDRVALTLENLAEAKPASFSWDALLAGHAEPSSLRRMIMVVPVLQTQDLEPGHKATEAIRQTAADLRLSSKFQANVRVTGPVPIADEEFASVMEGISLNGLITGLIVIAILWLALQSFRLVIAVTITLAVGLIVTAGLGLFLVSALNPVSMAFAILFVGLGADFAVQFNLRYRAQRYASSELHQSLLEAGERVGAPLTLASVAAAIGFLSFTPTAYTGLAQLGIIAGCGMIVAFVASFTLLPALIAAVRPPPESKPLRQPALAPIDHFLKRHRVAVISLTAILVLAGLPVLTELKFDFNPLHLQSKHSQAVSTFLELSKDPEFDANSAQVLASSHKDALAIASKLDALPQVDRTRTIAGFVPSDQERKLSLIRHAAAVLGPALTVQPQAEPTDAVTIAMLREAAKKLGTIAGQETSRGAQAAQRLAHDLSKLADAPAEHRKAATEAFITPLKMDLGGLSQALNARPIDLESLPPDLVQDWVTKDGHERVDVLPKGNPNNDETLRNFARAVLAAEPRATGRAVEIQNWAETMIRALIEAAAIAFCAIAILLWIPLRRLGDVVLTLVPLLVAALATLEICALTGFQLNYANIIAFPVLLGIGVAFKIYYIMAWRRGQTDFLQSALTRAVFFSALLTGTAFGSLWFSSNPGMSSMGKLLALSLACTLASAVLFQPALMGDPRPKPKSPIV